MMWTRRFVFFVLAGLWFAPHGTAAQGQGPLYDLVIQSGDQRHAFRVEWANTPESQARGLMFRRSMPANQGMWFDFMREQPISMWMKNTFIPLDMLFVNADGVIQHIHERAIPHNETTISPPRPARYVLELNGGTASRLGLRAGDRVIQWPR